MSITPDHGLRIKTPPADIDEEESPSHVYRKALDGLQRAERCRVLGSLPYIYGIVILMVAALKLCFNVPITSEEALLTLGIFALVYIAQIVIIVITTKPVLKKSAAELDV
jgi:hypothetical protein